jgi:hypothetical protein
VDKIFFEKNFQLRVRLAEAPLGGYENGRRGRRREGEIEEEKEEGENLCLIVVRNKASSWVVTHVRSHRGVHKSKIIGDLVKFWLFEHQKTVCQKMK